MADKPSKLPEWALVPSVDPVVGGANIVEPPPQLKDSGWLRGQLPPANYMNWLQNLTYQWLEYLDIRVDEGHTFGSTVDGLGLENSVLYPNTGTTISPGSFKDITSKKSFTLATSLTKEDTVAWEEGDEKGSLPAALTITANTYYHKFMLAKLDGTIDSGIDPSINAANLLVDPDVVTAGYTIAKRIGTIFINASLQIRPFKMIVYPGKRTILWDSMSDISIGSVSTSPATYAIDVPPDLEIEAIVGSSNVIAGSGGEVAIYTPGIAAPGYTDLIGTTPTISNNIAITNTNRQVQVRSNISGSIGMVLYMKGWNEYL